MTKIIGLRREDKNPWERRVSLIPTHVRELILHESLQVLVQTSPIRIFPDTDYEREGAQVVETLESCPIIFALKEIPLDFFEKEKAYIFFSHTIKGQPSNMPMLQKILDLECTLIDYERIVDENGMRLVFFSTQAGQAGMVDTLWAYGQRLSHLGIKTPFSSIKQAIQYPSLIAAKEEISQVGWAINNKGLDLSEGPLICGFAGYGRVSLGAQEIFDLLPFEEITPDKIVELLKSKSYSSSTVYKVIFKENHMVEPISSDSPFELEDYYNNPQKYRSVFEKYLPYLSILMNCIYWTQQYPRFVTKSFLKQLWTKEDSPKLKVIGDISCDVDGSVECTVRATSPDNPIFVYDPIRGDVKDGYNGRGVVVMAVDNLPAEISLESSVFFSQSLMPLVKGIAEADFSGDFEGSRLPDPIKKATIVFRGKFTPDYEYMRDFLIKRKES
ncbi:MAG: bifunctional lysine ketoglutarate reductase /saccharopine dehydrogenase family protein [Candidatus Aminicenantaceae bacterium]